jgi:soluble lytic murein transglycosylase-like protein
MGANVMGSFISDAEMAQLEQSFSSPSPSKSFISDDEMNALESSFSQNKSINELLGSPKDRIVSVPLIGEFTIPKKAVAASRAGIGQIVKSIPFNIGDEIAGGAAAGYDWLTGKGNTYDQRLKQARNLEEAASRTAPLISGAGELAANLAVPFKSSVGLKTGALAKTGQAAKEGAAIGGLYGFGEGQGGLTNRVDSAKSGATIGAFTGGGLTLAGEGIAALSSRAKNASGDVLEKGLGIQYGDKKKGLSKINLYVDDTGNVVPLEQLDSAVGVKAPLQMQVKALKEAGVFDNAPNNIELLSKHIKTNQINFGNEIRSLEKIADDAIPKQLIKPDLEETANLLYQYSPSEQAKLTKVLETKWQDYLQTPGEGFKKITTFLNTLQKETNFDQLTPKATTELKRALSYDFRKTSEKVFDEYLPKMAGQYSKTNELYAATKAIGKTLNGPLAKRSPEFMDFITGGSLPMTVLGGASLGVTGGVLPASALILGRAGKKYGETAYPMSASKGYQALGNVLKKTGEATSNNATKAVAALSAIGKSYEDKLQPVRPQSYKQSSSKLLQNQTINKALNSPSLNSSTLRDGNQGKTSRIFDALLDSIKQVESAGGKYTTGPKTKYGVAKGAYQVLDSTGKEYHKKLGIKAKYDPYNETQQRKIASAILSDYIAHFDGDVSKGITAYHSGIGNVEKGKLGPQGRAYLPKVSKVFERLLQNA